MSEDVCVLLGSDGVFVAAGWAPPSRRIAAQEAALSAHFGAPATFAPRAPDETGPPRLQPPFADWRVSRASRGAAFAVACAKGRVGVDVEGVGRAEAPAWNVLHPNERRAVAASAAPHETFLRLWTAKEAYLKALCVGLAREPAAFEARLEEGARWSVWEGARRVGVGGGAMIAQGARRALVAWIACDADAETAGSGAMDRPGPRPTA